MVRSLNSFEYPASRGFSLSSILASTMSFASRVSRVAGLFYKPQERHP